MQIDIKVHSPNVVFSFFSYQGWLGLSTLAVRDIIHVIINDVVYMPCYDCICCPEIEKKTMSKI